MLAKFFADLLEKGRPSGQVSRFLLAPSVREAVEAQEVAALAAAATAATAPAAAGAVTAQPSKDDKDPSEAQGTARLPRQRSSVHHSCQLSRSRN